MLKIFEARQVSSLGAATEWINSPSLDPRDLRSQVVLIDFWTFTCINWLRQLPYLRAWSRWYERDGLVVIGVHTPEFAFEHDTDRVRRAVATRAIEYPVAVDNDYLIWTAFANHYWPALYFIDADGVTRDFHYGEGRYEQSERVIQKLLGINREPAPIDARGIEAPAAWHDLRSNETYLGYERGERFSSDRRATPHERQVYEVPDRLRSDHWALNGEWTFNSEYVELARAQGAIHYRFDARDAHLVLARRATEPVPFRVLLDGEAPGPSHGEDIDEDGNGILDEGRLYQLVRQCSPVRKRVLEITFFRPGVEAYAFSFG